MRKLPLRPVAEAATPVACQVAAAPLEVGRAL